MRSRTLRRLLIAGLLLSLVARSPAVDPYQSRIDREYRSLSNSISRAYSPPPPSPPRSYTSSSYSSSSSYTSNRSSSFSSSSSSSRYSSSSSYSSPSRSYGASAAEARSSREQIAQRQKEATARKKKEAANKAALTKKAVAAAKVLRESPTETAAAWQRTRSQTEGRAPLVAPARGALESRRAEFEYFSAIARREGAKAPWENMRAGQLCLLAQGDGASPDRAFGYFSNSDPSWVEVQHGLGLCYLRGYGVTADPARARDLLERAANNTRRPAVRYIASGDLFPNPGFEAARDLGIACDLGLGQPADPRLALRWYEIADNRPLVDADREQVKNLRVEFWRRHRTEVRAFIEQDFAAVKAGGPSVLENSLFSSLAALGDAQALYDAGDLYDIRNSKGEVLDRYRGGMSFFFAAAKLGHEPSARRFFSPAPNGMYELDLGGDAFWAARLEYVKEAWPKWEKLWLEAAAKGDAAANVPLAFYYSGLRGNPADPKRAQEHASRLPADLPERQRNIVKGGSALAEVREKEEWAHTVFVRFGTTSDKVDFSILAAPRDPARARALREEANALPPSESLRARDLWRDAAVLGDLPALVQLFVYAKRNTVYLGSRFDASLQARLEQASREGEAGATAALAVLMDARVANTTYLSTASSETGRTWEENVLRLAPGIARFLEIADQPRLADADVDARRRAALEESNRWTAILREWGLGGFYLATKLTLTNEQVRAVDTRRAQYVALAGLDATLRTQLEIWEASGDVGFEAEADARFGQALDTWNADDKSERDPALVLDYLTQATGLGHPIAPLFIAAYYGTGHGGFPADSKVGLRFRALADARLTALAEEDDRWAQTVLGHMLVASGSDENKSITAFEWLPGDAPRGLRWLERAATAGSALPSSFGDSSGQTVAFFLSSYYHTAGDRGAWCKWNLIDFLYRQVDDRDKSSEAEWVKTQAAVDRLLAEKPEVWTARAELDTRINEAEDEAAQAKALFTRARQRRAAGLAQAALFDAEFATRLTSREAASWREQAPYQRDAGETKEAGLSEAIAAVLEKKPGALAAFEAAYRQVDDQRREFLQFAFSTDAEEPNASPEVKALAASATKISPPKKE